MNIFKKIFADDNTENSVSVESKLGSNKEIISAYNRIREAVPDYNEPNYSLAEKVFREFNDFNLMNLEKINAIYLGYVPQSLLPYPKNYIKCAYYIYLELAKKQQNPEMFKLIQSVGTTLFFDYPDYPIYKKNLQKKKFTDEALRDMNLREKFKNLYGVYEISEEDYYSSPSSVDSTNDQLIHDFGFLPEIEEDVDWNKARAKQ